MKKLIFLIFVLGACLVASNPAPSAVDELLGISTVDQILGQTTATSQVVAYTQDMEGTGTPTNWTDTNSPDWDFSTSGLSLESSECLQFADESNESTIYDPSYNEDEYYWTFWWRATALLAANGGNEFVIYVRDSSNGILGYLLWEDSDEGLDCVAVGGTLDGSSTTVSADTTYKIKVYYKVGSGANAEFRAWLWNDSSWDVMCASTDGTDTDNIDHIRFRNANTGTEDQYYDYLKGNPTDITSPD